MKKFFMVSIVLFVWLCMVGWIWLFSYPPPPVDEGWMVSPAGDIPEGAVSVRYAGTATLLFTDGDTSWMVDGWFSRPGPLRLLFGDIEPDMLDIDTGMSRMQVTELAAVIPMHSHYDHAMDAPEVARRTGATLYGSESTANIARGWGLPEAQIALLENWTPVQIGDFVITPIESKHFQFPDPDMVDTLLTQAEISAPLVPPVSAFDYKLGKAYILHVKHPQGTFMVVGSAGFVPGQLQGLAVDTLFVGVGGVQSQTPEYGEQYWAETVGATSPSRIVPIHWDSLTGPLRGPLYGEVRISDITGEGADALRDWLRAKKEQHPEARFETLPRFAEVVVFP